MYSDGKKRLKKKRGNTDDIIREVFATFNDTWQQCAEIAPMLRGATEYETCRNIFDYIIRNVEYIEDPDGVQNVKTPGRLKRDGFGDCKSMAIMAASCCKCLNIPCVFRFVAFGTPNVTHVYVVTESGIIIDPVERVDGKPKFNYASRFTKNIDMNTTSIYRLSGIGASTDIYEVWMNGTCFVDNTFALNYLFSEIDMLMALLVLDENNIETLNACDRAVVALKLYEQATGSSTMLNRAANILQAMNNAGKFNENSVDDESRAAHLQSVINYALDRLLAADGVQAAGPVNEWFTENITKQDYNSVTAEIKENYKNYIAEQQKVSGIGAVNKNELCQKVQESAGYYCYYFLSNDFIKKFDTKGVLKLKQKRSIEQRLYTSWVQQFVKAGVDSKTCANWLYAGYVKKYKCTPEQMVLNSIVKGGKAKVGAISATVASIIIAVVCAVIEAITKIIQTCIEKKYQSIENYPSGAATEDDFSGVSSTDVSTANGMLGNNDYSNEDGSGNGSGNGSGINLDSNTIMLVAAAGLAAVLLMKK